MTILRISTQANTSENITWTGFHTFPTPNINGGFDSLGTVNVAGQVVGRLRNSSNSNVAQIFFNVVNDVPHNGYLGLSSSTYVGQEWTSGPTGEQFFVGCSGNIPFTFGTNNTYRGQISGGGVWRVFVPTVGTGLIINGQSADSGASVPTTTTNANVKLLITKYASSSIPVNDIANSYYMGIGYADYGVAGATPSYRLIGLGYIASANSYPCYIGYVETSDAGQTLGDFVVGTRNVTTDTQPSRTLTVTAAGAVCLNAISTGTGTALVGSTNNSVLLQSSSIRYKLNVEPLWSNVAIKVLDLQPSWYRSNPDTTVDPPEHSYIGLIAEDVANVEPRLVNYRRKDEADANSPFIPQSVAYDRLAVMLISVIKDQQNTIDAINARLAAIESKVS